MKTPLWCLLALMACLFSPGRCDCQAECVACGLLLEQQQLQQTFNAMLCLLECEGHVSSSLMWEVCKRAVRTSHQSSLPPGGAILSKRTQEQEPEPELTPLDLDSDDELLQSVAAERFRARDEAGEANPERRGARYDSPPPVSLEEGEEEESLRDLALRLVSRDGKAREGREAEGGKGPEEGDDDDEASEEEEEEEEEEASLALSKRFGGFLRGRHGYRKLIGSPARPLQKRYGGFIGVRKSARKWNSQKRVNQLLKQYLGMRSSRSGRFNSIPINRVWRQNQL